MELAFPTSSILEQRSLGHQVDLNDAVNAVLRTIYDITTQEGHIGRRNVVFTSFSPDVCAALNLKQPNCEYKGVFATMDPWYTHPTGRSRILCLAVRTNQRTPSQRYSFVGRRRPRLPRGEPALRRGGLQDEQPARLAPGCRVFGASHDPETMYAAYLTPRHGLSTRCPR